MNLCSDEHQEVCFEGRACPLCAMRDDKDSEIQSRDNKIDDLNNQIEELTSE